MGEQRTGDGRVVSSAAVKQTMGRSFLQTAKYHTGNRADPTHWAAEARDNRKPSAKEMQMLFDENPINVRALRAAGLSDEQIYDALSNS